MINIQLYRYFKTTKITKLILYLSIITSIATSYSFADGNALENCLICNKNITKNERTALEYPVAYQNPADQGNFLIEKFGTDSYYPDRNLVLSDYSNFVTRVVGGLKLTIPNGYIASTDGYRRNFDYLRFWALLPCLTPESAQNTQEFHKVTLGSSLVATLTFGDIKKVGQQWLDAISSGSHTPPPVSIDSNTTLITNSMLGREIYIQKNSTPVFFINCSVIDKFAIYAHCEVHEHIFDNVHLDYIYNRNFVETSGKIDIEKLLR